MGITSFFIPLTGSDFAILGPSRETKPCPDAFLSLFKDGITALKNVDTKIVEIWDFSIVLNSFQMRDSRKLVEPNHQEAVMPTPTQESD